MLKQLRLKFVCIVMAIVTIMLSLVFGMVIHFMKANLEEQSIRLLRSISDNPFQQGNPGDVSEEVQLPYFTVLLSYRGQLVAKSGGYYDLSDEVTILKITRAALESGAQSGVLEEYNLRFIRSTVSTGQWLVFADISSERTALRNLTESCRILLLHLTDVKPSNGRFTRYGTRLRVHAKGSYPYLLRTGSVRVGLKNSAKGRIRLFALDSSGKRREEIPFAEQNGHISFVLRNDRGEFAPLAYELIRE